MRQVVFLVVWVIVAHVSLQGCGRIFRRDRFLVGVPEWECGPTDKRLHSHKGKRVIEVVVSDLVSDTLVFRLDDKYVCWTSFGEIRPNSPVSFRACSFYLFLSYGRYHELYVMNTRGDTLHVVRIPGEEKRRYLYIWHVVGGWLDRFEDEVLLFE